MTFRERIEWLFRMGLLVFVVSFIMLFILGAILRAVSK